ncbi:hypothetical protein A3K34_00320 [candidate division WWE3 bacterium RIFOXYC1_FULL_40_10]|uniref:Sodium/calcium exchanger membrane region domain-containing protein n=1 Tax=candidate division WWE3 bacterium RIFOXYA2_FULL_46_9 TaxID=1802636 RepID=A0A1F4W1F8_UNCKA|nr:MAG: hypothetical protein A3K58_00320 [candidate division WWE3 bacterium RIFOXYB1_FULL_40_22]OGC61336.1 MAG: hypothetical protein A3K37_00320 [candidate division WWE3 bacterium RIFOXYA1_FULL_40_11]OGC63246.1 MAG: hypothetical protein A2264_00975 [candidate division WWE3 bacterium RIFOXYA2_FULL_46_9]OGC65326.1 MAG: hypothetical protein A2326_04605 [candidate division WWE3 bacterium RIFOXYB2_FULL_41_6]OGC65719.1 MAG: hypothetical protein A3K34_00320 [candidate division WWE3 bacterium RIFOXYC1_
MSIQALENILLIVLSSIVLIKAVETFSKSASCLAKHFDISSYTISFVLVALATSLPEVLVGVESALKGTQELSFGNAIGSNIALLSLVPAVVLLFAKKVSSRRVFSTKDIYFAIIFSCLTLGLAYDNLVSRIDALILLACYLIYTVAFLEKSSLSEKVLEKLHHKDLLKQVTLFVISLLVLVTASEFIVRSSLGISQSLGISIAFVGLTLTAVGTSLPEIVFSIKAVEEHDDSSVMGNLIGSVIVNSTVVIAITALVNPITIINSVAMLNSGLFALLAMIVFFIFSDSQKNINRFEALVLLVIYIGFIARQFFIN